MNKVWHENEKDYIRQNAATMTDEEIAKTLTVQLNRPVTLQAVRKQRQKLKIVKAHGRGVCKLAEKPLLDGSSIGMGVYHNNG